MKNSVLLLVSALALLSHAADIVYDVPENEIVTIDSPITTVENPGVDRIIKRGAGTLKIAAAIGTWSYRAAAEFASFDVEAGLVIYNSNAQLKPNIHIFKGAEFRTVSTSGGKQSIGRDTLITIDEGGLYDGGGVEQIVAAVVGAGTATNCALHELTLAHGPYTFTGDYHGSLRFSREYFSNPRPTDEQFVYIVGAANAFADANVGGARQATYDVSTVPTLQFAPGIGTFTFKTLTATAVQRIRLNDTAGEPITLYAGLSGQNNLLLAGSGTFMVCHNNLTWTNPALFTGFTGRFGVSWGENFLGDGTAAHDMDYSTLSGIVLESGNSSSPGQLWIRPSVPTTIPCPLSGSGRVRVNCAPVTFSRVEMDGYDYWYPYTNMTICSGWLRLKNNFSISGSDVGFTLDGGEVSGQLKRGANQRALDLLLHPSCITLSGANNGKVKTLTVNGGEITMKDYVGRMTYLNGGRISATSGLTQPSTATVADPSDFIFNGGELCIRIWDAPYDFSVFGSSYQGGKYRILVGEKGGVIRQDTWVDPSEKKANFYQPILSGVAAGKDGGLVKLGGGAAIFHHPVNLTGPLSILDGILRIPNSTGITAATDPIFGRGDMRLGNVLVECAEGLAARTIPFVEGEGARLFVDGAVTLRVRTGANKPAYTFAIGREGSTASPIVRGKGAVLFAFDDSGAELDGSGPKVVIRGQAASAFLPGMFSYAGVTSRGTNRRLDFVRYEATNGAVAFTDYVEGVAGGGASVAKITAQTTVDADASVAALRVDGVNNIKMISPESMSAVLMIDANRTLTVGNGIDPAMVVLNNGDEANTASIGGAGTIDFGDSEGVIASGPIAGGAYPGVIKARIAGRSGLALVGAVCDKHQGIALGGDNSYAGGTTINGVVACPWTDTAFGTDPITIGSGEYGGGRLNISVAGLKIENAISVSGFGPEQNGIGAIDIHKDVEFSGQVQMTGLTKVRADSGAVGTFSGKVSGDRLMLWEGAGTVRFTHANDYTGGTEVVATTLALAEAGTAGSGAITLNGGTLLLESGKSTFAVSNEVNGVGTVKLAGKGRASFANLKPQEPFTLALGRVKNPVVNSLRGFSAVTTDRTGAVHLSVLNDADGSYAGTLPMNVTVHYGKEYVAGLTIILR